MTKITLQTIADKAGLSKFAVSRALSGKSGVSDETRKRISELATEMGYKRVAKAKRPLVALMCEDKFLINGEMNQKIQFGVRDEAYRLGVELVDLHTRSARPLSEVLPSVSGLIFVGVTCNKILGAANKSKLPQVRIGYSEPHDFADIVRFTHFEAGTVVGQEILAMGHTRLAFVSGDQHFRGRQQRFNGFLSAAKEVLGATVVELCWNDSAEFSMKMSLLLNDPSPPTAYFCAHDGLAVTMITELLSRSIRVPRDVSVVGFGDYISALQVRPALTTMSVPGEEMGREALKLVHSRLKDDQRSTYRMRILIPGKFIVRDSLGRCRNER